MKEGIRAMGIDDGPQRKKTLVVGVVMRRDRFEGLISTRVMLDGNEATERIMERISSSRFARQLHVVFVNGVAVAGFNLVNYVEMAERLGVPVIALTPNEPHPEELEKAIEKWKEKRKMWERMKRPARKLLTPFGPVWYQHAGTEREEAERLIRHFIIHSKLPEPLRIAHMIAAGIELGESRGI